VNEIPEDVLKEYPMFGEMFTTTPYEVLLRFGMWDQVLAEPDLPEFLVLTRAFRHAARGIAYAAKGNTESARAEQSAFLEASKQIPADHPFVRNSS
jgi:hypothetical protein